VRSFSASQGAWKTIKRPAGREKLAGFLQCRLWVGHVVEAVDEVDDIEATPRLEVLKGRVHDLNACFIERGVREIPLGGLTLDLVRVDPDVVNVAVQVVGLLLQSRRNLDVEDATATSVAQNAEAVFACQGRCDPVGEPVSEPINDQRLLIRAPLVDAVGLQVALVSQPGTGPLGPTCQSA
jgi:hypothetical protein